jgi:hypothetical protein
LGTATESGIRPCCPAMLTTNSPRRHADRRSNGLILPWPMQALIGGDGNLGSALSVWRKCWLDWNPCHSVGFDRRCSSMSPLPSFRREDRSNWNPPPRGDLHIFAWTLSFGDSVERARQNTYLWSRLLAPAPMFDFDTALLIGSSPILEVLPAMPTHYRPHPINSPGRRPRLRYRHYQGSSGVQALRTESNA